MSCPLCLVSLSSFCTYRDEVAVCCTSNSEGQLDTIPRSSSSQDNACDTLSNGENVLHSAVTRDGVTIRGDDNSLDVRYERRFGAQK